MAVADTEPTAASDAIGLELGRALSAGKLNLPPLPGVATEVLSSTSGDQADAKRLAELIQRDQSLASHVMRVVNSPLFRGSIEVVSLQQAIARLGMERVRDIAFTASVSAVLLANSRYENLVRSAWKRSLTTGLWAKEVARSCRKNVELAYLAGLFHNVGTPLVVRFIEEYDEVISAERVDSLIEEFGKPAAQMLFIEWKLPASLSLVLERYQRWQEQSPPDDLALMTATAVLFASTLEACPDANEARAGLVGTAECEALNLYPEDVDALLERAESVRETMESMS